MMRVDSSVPAHQHENLAKYFTMVASDRIHVMHAFRFASLFVNDYVAYDCVGDQRHSAGPRCSGKRRCRTAVVRLGCASSITMTAPVAGGSGVRSALMNRLGQYCATSYDDPAVRVAELIDGFLQHHLAAGQAHRRQKLAIGKLRQLLIGPAYSNELFDLIVVRRKLFVTDGPVVAVAIVTRRFEVIVRKPVSLPSPRNRSTADLPRANPVKRFVGRVV